MLSHYLCTGRNLHNTDMKNAFVSEQLVSPTASTRAVVRDGKLEELETAAVDLYEVLSLVLDMFEKINAECFPSKDRDDEMTEDQDNEEQQEQDAKPTESKCMQ